MPRSAATKARRAEATDAARTILEGLVWDVAEPAVESAMATREATRALHHELNDRIALLRVVSALKRSPLDALAALQRCEPFADHPAGAVDLGLFEAFLCGAASGGVDGDYGRAYLATIAAAAPFVASLH